MFIILDNNRKFSGFSQNNEMGYTCIEITEEKHKEMMQKQSEGYTLFYNKEKELLESLKLGQFDYIDESGNIAKDIQAEQKYKNNKIIELKRERVQLKKDRKDFIEYEEDTTELDKRIAEITKELEELEG